MALAKATSLALKLRGAIGDDRVLAAIANVPRERFVLTAEQGRAYDNIALPISCGQTISQPLVVARMLEVLRLGVHDRVLDVGTGSGYHAALLALLAGHVWTIERHEELSVQSQRVIAELGLDNVTFLVGDGWEGLPAQAPFDAINVAAATGERVPSALEEQLAEGGRLVAPVGSTDQRLVLIRRIGGEFLREGLEPVRFVPLVHEEPE